MEYPLTVAALDVGGTKIAGALVHYAEPDAAPRVSDKRSVPTDAARGGAAVLDSICLMAQQLLDEAHAAGSPACGVAVSTAGRVDARTGAIAYANEIMPGWTGQPVAERLRACCSVPVAVLNDVQSHGLGEARWGAARGAQTCLMIAAGTGVGGAVIAHGHIVRGKHGFAGEVGHMPCVQAAGIPCTCGGTAHLESVAAGSGIETCYVRAGGEPLNGAQIAARAADGEERAARIIRQAGAALGDAIAGFTNMLDPDMVVIAGSVLKAGALWHTALQEAFERQIPEAQRDLPIVEAALADDAPLVGAAENLLDSLKG